MSNSDGGNGARKQSQLREVVEIETYDTLAHAQDHLPVLVALHEGVSMFRAELGGAFDEFSDMELMKMIRATYGYDQPCADIAARINADDAAIKRALNAGAFEFAQRLHAKSRC